MARSTKRVVADLRRQVSALVDSVEGLQSELAAARERISTLERENDELRARLGMNSQNSSKPPSSDGPGAPEKPPRKPTGRKPGGQPGRKKAERSLVPPERVDETFEYRPVECEGCGASLPDADSGEIAERHQVWELPPIRAVVTEHQRMTVTCPCCQHETKAVFPPDVQRGVFGPRLMAVLAVLGGRFRLSRREVVAISDSLFDIPISLGSVAKICATAGKLFGAPVAEVREAVRAAQVANADETSFKHAGTKGWLWVAVTAGCTLFHLAASRGSDVIKDILAGFEGIVGSDRFSSYKWLPLSRRQLCWAHLKRNLLAVYQRGGYGTGLGKRGGEIVGQVFKLWHRHRGSPSRAPLKRAISPVRKRFKALLEEYLDCQCPKARRFAKELLDEFDALWTFVEVEGVEPTNNVAERALRPAVLWRKGSFGTQSEDGVDFVHGSLTVAATCKQRGRDLIEYVSSLFRAHAEGKLAPSIFERA